MDKTIRLEYSLVKDQSMMEKVVDLHDEVFLAEEPVNKWFNKLGIVYDDWCLRANRADLVKKMAQGYSVVATDPANGGKAVGARISYRLSKSEADLFTQDERLRNHIRYRFDCLLFQNCCSFDRIGQHLPQVKEVMVFHFLFVHPKYQRLGIARELINRSIKIAKENKFEAIVVCATSNITKAHFQKIGFTCAHQMHYREFNMSEYQLDPSQYQGETADMYVLRL